MTTKKGGGGSGGWWLLWPARATTKTSLAAPRHPLAGPVGWEFLRGVGEISGLLPELTNYCNLSHEKKTHKRITNSNLLSLMK